MWNVIAGNLLKVLTTAIISASPEVKEMLRGFVDQLEAKAEATPNKWDDILVSSLKTLLGM
jgi:hypothetical protein